MGGYRGGGGAFRGGVGFSHGGYNRGFAGGYGFGRGYGYGFNRGYGYRGYSNFRFAFGLGYAGYPYYWGYPGYYGYGYYPYYDYSYPSVGYAAPAYSYYDSGPVVVDQTFSAPAPAREYRPSAAADREPIYLIAFRDHRIVAAVAYWVEGDTLHYVTREREHKQIPLDEIDRAFSEQLNRDRRVEFRLPR